MKDFALITGASGGIGYYFAHELARKKHNVLLVARSGDKLMELKNLLTERYQIQCEYVAMDLSVAGAADQLFDWCTTRNYEINILINNAGYGLFGYFEKQEVTEVKNMMQLNMNTLMELCHIFLPMLKTKPKAYIMNVASTASYQAVPTLSVYAATKAFVVLFTRGLRYELKNTSVSVSCLSPGATSTNFIDRARLQAIKERADKFSMSAGSVARIGIDGMFKGKPEIIPGFVNWFSSQLTGFVPKVLTEKIAAGLYKDALK
ncbi:MAG TPA: SDR family oxidoreductase [Cyclobacteriaceae bacterium]|mgnify:CR=1 FL=1|nr:SDR family oxidoreductase [Cyclobacteriaceae bacterium]HPW63249.1 SDR family oxidoreductase [Cyclobacteriaceae bacterium]